MRKREMDKNPILQFEIWYKEARASGHPQPEAMALATASPSGEPSVRMVLLKGIREDGFEFYTNLESRKGREIEANPQAAAVFWWENLHRQIRIEGRVDRVDDERANQYFRTRPRGSQIGAWASRQSSVIANRESLERLAQKYEAMYEGREVPRPPLWGGLRLIPFSIEFWEERADRLHDRLIYRRLQGEGWVMKRLAP